jgi:hypothetical protein
LIEQDVVVGRPRDGDDRVAWLLDHHRFDKALAVLESDRGLKASTHEQVPLACLWDTCRQLRPSIILFSGHAFKMLRVLFLSRVLRQVTQRYLEYLVSQSRFQEAAEACSKLLKVTSTF